MMMLFGNDEGSESDDDDEGPALPPSFSLENPPTLQRSVLRHGGVKSRSSRRGNRGDRDGSGRDERNATGLDRDSFDFGSAVGAGADSVSGRRDIQNGCQ